MRDISKFLLIAVFFLLMIETGLASTWSPQGNVDLKNRYYILNDPAENCSVGYYTRGKLANGSWICAADTDTNSFWNLTGSQYLFNDSGILDVNETALNTTIDARDDDTTYTAGSNLTLTGTVFSLDVAAVRNWLDEVYYFKSNPFGYYNSTDFDINDYYLDSNPYGFYNSTNPQTEYDPLWTSNQSLYYTATQIDSFAYYNLTNFDIEDYYLKSNSFGFYNSSDFNIGDYYLKSNPFGYYNSTNPQTETDPIWTAVASDYSTTADIVGWGYYNLTDFNIGDYYLLSNPYGYYNLSDFDINDYFTQVKVLSFGYYNETDFDINDYATLATILGFNYYNSTDFSISDYYLKSNPYSFYNSTNPQTETDPLWTSNQSLYLALSGGTMTGNLITENLTAQNITATGYLEGQPLDSIGSGVIECDSIDSKGGVDLTISDLDVTYPNMLVRLIKTDNSVKYCNITSDTVTVPDNQHSVYYVDNNCAIQYTTMETYITTAISPGGITDIFNVFAQDGEIGMANGISVKNKETIKTRKTILNTLNLQIINGMSLSEDEFPGVYQESGKYVYLRSIVDATAQNSTTNGIHQVGHSGGSWVHNNQTGLNLSYCDDGTNFVTCATNKYRRYLIYTVGFQDGSDKTTVHVLTPRTTDTQYNNLGDCLNVVSSPISYTLPSSEKYVAVPTYVYCGARDATAWNDGWIDIRQGGGGIGAIPDLSLFLTKDGTTPLTANWNAGAYNITASYFIGDGSQLTGLTLEETDPLWTSNQSLYYTSSQIDSFAYYNGTSFNINEYYLKSNPFGFYNSTDFSIIDYYLKSNPFNYYNSTDFSINDYYLKSNPFSYYNSTDFSIVEYSTTTEMNTAIENSNTSLYDWVVAQDYTTAGITWADAVNGTLALTSDLDSYATNTKVDSLGNWSNDKSDYSTTAEANDLYYGISNPYSYYNSTNPQSETDPLWTSNQSLYYTSSEIDSFAYYNGTDFDINDYYLKSNPFSYYNSTDFVIVDYATNTKVDSLGNWSNDKSSYSTTAEANDLYYSISNPMGFYNSTDFSIDDYYLKSNPFSYYKSTNPQSETDPLWTSNQSLYYTASQIDSFAYYNLTDFSISDYYLKSNPFEYYNTTDFDITNYYLKSNPFGFYNSTNPQTETDPLWTDNSTNVPLLDTQNSFTAQQNFTAGINVTADNKLKIGACYQQWNGSCLNTYCADTLVMSLGCA